VNYQDEVNKKRTSFDEKFTCKQQVTVLSSIHCKS